MKRGEVIDTLSASKIANNFSRIQYDYQVRPVIWPERLIQPVMKIHPKEFNGSKPKRPLVHIICCDEEIRWISSLMTLDPYTLEISLGTATYDGEMKTLGACNFYYEDEAILKRVRKLDSKAAQNAFNLKKLFAQIAKAVSVDGLDFQVEGFQFYLIAYLLEFYAFSPYASTKLKPVFRAGFNNKPLPKEWPIVEVVNLRMPEKRDSPESVGHRKYSVQFPVASHFRRLVDKEGKERFVKVSQYVKGPKDAPLKPSIPKVYKMIK